MTTSWLTSTALFGLSYSLAIVLRHAKFLTYQLTEEPP